MQRPRAPPLRAPRLLAAAVLVECCARLCPALGTGTGSTPGTAVPCARPGTAPGDRCRTDPERGAATGRAPTPEAVGRLRTEAELLPFPGTPPGAAEPPGPQGSPGGPQAGRKGTGPAVWDGAATQGPGPRPSAGSRRPSPAPAPAEPDTAPAAGSDPGVTVEGATTPQGTPSPSSSSTTVPSSAAGQGGSPSTLPGWSPRTGLVQRQGGSHGPSSLEPWAGEGLGATVPVGDSSPGTLPSTLPTADSPVLGTMGMSPSTGGLQRLLSPTGTLQGTQQGHETDVTWHGPRSAPRPSLPSQGASGRGGPLASTAQPATGTGLASLPATGKGSGLPVPTAMASTLGVTSPGSGGALDPTTGVVGPPDTEGPPEHSHAPLDQPWVALGSTAVPHTSPGTPHIPLSQQPDPAGGSAPTSPAPQSPLGTSQGIPGLSPPVGSPLAGPLGGTAVGVGDAEPWAATAPPSWQLGSPDPPSAPGPPRQPPWSQPASSPGLATTAGVTTISVTTTAVTATITAATASPALLGDVGTVAPEPGAAVLRGDVAGPPTHLPTLVPGPPQEPTDPPGTPGHHGVPGSPPAAGGTDLVWLPSSPGAWPDADPPGVTPAPAGRAPQVFIVEDQPPLLRVSLLRVPCELVLDMSFVPALQDPRSHEHQGLLRSFNRTVTPLFMSVPGFLRLEVTGIRAGSVVLQYDALFAAERVQVPELSVLLDAALGSGAARLGLAVGTAPVLRHVVLELPLDPCTLLFACRDGFACVAGADGNATCTSLCHRDYCKNHGICSHPPGRAPLCRCPVGSDFWFVGLRCDYRVTQQNLLGMAAGVLLSILLLGAILAAVAIRRFKALLLEARADQSHSSYRRFCRLDDVSAQYWSRSGLPSASSLDNPAFSNSEELLHLQILDNGCCICREDPGIPDSAKQHPALPARPVCQPSFHYDWDTSSSSMNDPMVDSGKASDISVSSWPLEPNPWTPFPLLHQLSRQQPHRARRPHSYCEGMELAQLERSWTA